MCSCALKRSSIILRYELLKRSNGFMVYPPLGIVYNNSRISLGPSGPFLLPSCRPRRFPHSAVLRANLLHMIDIIAQDGNISRFFHFGGIQLFKDHVTAASTFRRCFRFCLNPGASLAIPPNHERIKSRSWWICI